MTSPQFKDYDVVVIGAGVCGAIAAWQLALAGARVLILEAGPNTADRLRLVDQYALATPKRTGSPYRDPDNDRFAPSQDNFRGPGPKTYYDQAGPVDFQSTYVRRVGGSTWHFLGNMPRFLPNDFQLLEKYQVGRDWPIRYQDLEPKYVMAEHWIGVAGDHEQWNQSRYGVRSAPFPMSKIWPSYGDRVVEQRLNGLKIDGESIELMSTPQARNSRTYDGRPACAGNSSCVPICPIQAKYDATVHVQKAIQAGAELCDRCVVTRIECRSGASAVEAVHFRRWDNTDHEVRGKAIVLAAHAIESAKLLLLSGIANRSDQVGRNLMDHLQGSVFCIAPEPVFPFRGPPTTSGIDVFRDGPFRKQRAAFRLSLGNDGWGRSARPEDKLKELVQKEKLFGKTLRHKVEHTFTRMIRFSYSTEMLPDESNRVELSDAKDELGIRRPKLSFHVSPYNVQAFDKAREVCTTIFEHIGGVEVQFEPKEDKFTGAGHILGTCRMGTSQTDSVVDANGRSHDHRNLFLLGSTIFPTSGTANPTLTAVALTILSLEAIAADLNLKWNWK